MNIRLLVMMTLFALLSGCESSDSDDTLQSNTSRSFLMGFTPWLYEASFNAQAVTYQRIHDHGDMIKQHFTAGIPWQAALDASPYPTEVEAEIQGRLDNTASNQTVLLAIDSLNPLRTALADDWGASTNMPRSGDWATRSWRAPEVINAYLYFARDLITRFEPEYFEYGTEVSELILNDLSAYNDYLTFAEAVYNDLSSRFPQVKLVASVALKSPGSNEMQTIASHIDRLLPYIDVMGASAYPYAFFAHADKGAPANLPANWLSQISALSGGKPVGISETGWIAEDLNIPAYALSVVSDVDKQSQFATLLLEQANMLDAEFVIWWTTTDFDTLWRDTLGEDPLAAIWRDMGLYDELQQPRPALSVWDSYRDKPRN